MNEDFGIRVEEILNLPVFKKCRLLGGAEGLKRVITNVNVMEVPDILPWIKPGDFILTTAYAIKDDIEAQKSLIPQLARQGAAGLAIKSQRYIETIPLYMIEAANNLSFPLLELPVEVNFSELISSVLSQIVNRQAFFLEHSVRVHQQFTDLILNGGQLDQIAMALAELIDAYVCLEDFLNFRRVIYPLDVPVYIARYFERQDHSKKISGHEAGDFYGEQLSFNGQEADSAALPIIVEGRQYGWVKVVITERRFSLLELITVERVCSIAALDILRQHNVTQVENKYRAEFLSQLLTSSEYDEKLFLERGKTFGWDLSSNYAALLLEVLPAQKESNLNVEGRKQQDIKTQAAILIENFCQRQRLKYILVNNEDGITLFLEPDMILSERNTGTKNILHQLKVVLNYWQVTIGIGGGYNGIKGIKKSYREAKLALELGKYLFGNGTIIYYRNLGVYGLLLKHAGMAELKEFVQEMLGPLLAYDNSKKGELFKTLGTFLETNCNVKETAEKLYTHYNTVLYRVNKIKELTGVDFNNPDQMLNLQVAMRLSQVFNRFGNNIT
ncbi:Purine catabolism PurC-like domain [Moorella glycerini]|uniref:Purine catabolism regulatory protein n=1 Tax=Neomoorella stamsii TaxID=1266720 RepID=A0A9X7P6E9_9FIRM|nr:MULTISPECIES: PucR family transcriptional regulator [Moorella]PRR73433.1 Purine catabolism regulatory protein [Moorella stamsii]CEP69202.1 Purine catabolism PurC-like domain [Moorella glycerini]